MVRTRQFDPLNQIRWNRMISAEERVRSETICQANRTGPNESWGSSSGGCTANCSGSNTSKIFELASSSPRVVLRSEVRTPNPECSDSHYQKPELVSMGIKKQNRTFRSVCLREQAKKIEFIFGLIVQKRDACFGLKRFCRQMPAARLPNRNTKCNQSISGYVS